MLAKRVQYFSESVIRETTRLAQRFGAVNLGQGMPDFDPPEEVKEAACRAVRDGFNQYAVTWGIAPLRQAIAAKMRSFNGLGWCDPDEHVTVCCGATECMMAAMLALIDPGDEVVIFQPFYENYGPDALLTGATPKWVTLHPPNWHIDPDELRAAFSPRTKAVILNTPNNPTGTVTGRGTLEALADLCQRRDLVLLCDEVWEAMIFGGAKHVSPLALPALRERAIKIGSAGKIFSLTGWKVGWAVAAPPLAEAIARQHQFLTFTTATPLQWAAAEGLALSPAWHAAHRARYEAGRALLVGGLEAAGYVLLPADGTWFVTVDLAASGLPPDDEALCERLLREAGVASIPVSAFYRDAPEKGYLRLCFAKEEATLDEAITRLAAFRG
jgi:aspartate/methionine/tyrosine aminotransferase